MDVVCPYCQNKAMLVKGGTIYPHRKDLHEKYFYLCRKDKAYVGCHPGTTEPLGRLADAELRKVRSAAHAAFDPLWHNRAMKRKECYAYLAEHLGIRVELCHIGDFDVPTCRRVIAICKPRCNENCQFFETHKEGSFCTTIVKGGSEPVNRNQDPSPNCPYLRRP